MKKFAKIIVIWVLGIGGAIFLYGRFCDWFFTQQQYLDVANNKRAWNVAQKNKEFDFAVVGNSRAYGVFDMILLEKNLGKKGINLGAPGSGFVDNFLTLNLFLKNGNKIKTIFLQVDLYSLNSKLTLFDPFHKYHFVQYWRDPVVKNTILDYSSSREVRLLNIFPELRYVKFNKYFSPKEIVRRASSPGLKSGFDKTLGGRIDYPSLTISDNKKIASKELTYVFDKKDFEYLEKILFLCRTYDIQIVAFRAPEYQPFARKILNYNAAYSQVEGFLQRYNIPYLREKVALEEDGNSFYDATHLNKQGVVPYTMEFVKQIKSSLLLQ